MVNVKMNDLRNEENVCVMSGQGVKEDSQLMETG